MTSVTSRAVREDLPGRRPRADPIRLLRPELPPAALVERYFERSRALRWYSNGGPCHELLVERLRARLGGAHPVPVSSCTTGLLLALRALAGRPGGRTEVLLPSFTFAATATAVTWCGFTPVFVDVDGAGWHVSPEALRETVEDRADRVAAIVTCSTFGTPPPLEVTASWESVARDAGVPLIVDSAAGFGGESDGVPLGAQGDAEVFSWHATKPFCVGEGGLVSCTRPDVAERVAALANFGFDPDRIVADEPGLNGKLDEWHCAAALALLDSFEAVLVRRRRSAERMIRLLVPHGFAAQAGAAGGTFQLVHLLAPSGRARDAARASALAEGIETAAYFSTPLHRMPAFAAAPRGPLDVTEDLAARMVSLPMANDLTTSESDRIIDAVASAAHGGNGLP